MANKERTGFRDQAYSTWHRSLSDNLSFMDIDWIEWCKTCSKLLAVYELKLDTPANAESKTWVTKRIAEATNAKGFLVLYSKNSDGFITGFRVQQLAPRQTALVAVSPDEWASAIYKFRWCHPIAAPARSSVNKVHVCAWTPRDSDGKSHCVYPGCPATWTAELSAGNPGRGEDKTEPAPALSSAFDDDAALAAFS